MNKFDKIRLYKRTREFIRDGIDFYIYTYLKDMEYHVEVHMWFSEATLVEHRIPQDKPIERTVPGSSFTYKQAILNIENDLAIAAEGMRNELIKYAEFGRPS